MQYVKTARGAMHYIFQLTKATKYLHGFCKKCVQNPKKLNPIAKIFMHLFVCWGLSASLIVQNCRGGQSIIALEQAYKYCKVHVLPHGRSDRISFRGTIPKWFQMLLLLCCLGLLQLAIHFTAQTNITFGHGKKGIMLALLAVN